MQGLVVREVGTVARRNFSPYDLPKQASSSSVPATMGALTFHFSFWFGAILTAVTRGIVLVKSEWCVPLYSFRRRIRISVQNQG